MSMPQQRTAGQEPPRDEEWAHIAYPDVSGYAADRQLKEERLGWIYFSELKHQWSVVMDYVRLHEFERLSAMRRADSDDGGSEIFVPWLETASESEVWLSSMWISTSIVDNILSHPPPADICEGTRIIEQERIRRDRERKIRRAQGFFAIWEAAREAAPAMRMEECDVLESIQRAAHRGELPAYVHGASLPIHAVVGAHAHPKQECSAEDLDNWMKANRIRCDFSFVARARELATAEAAGECTSTPLVGSPVAKDAARWKQADAAGKRALAEEALRQYGNQTRAAEALGISRMRLYKVLHGGLGAMPASTRKVAADPVSLAQAWDRRGP